MQQKYQDLVSQYKIGTSYQVKHGIKTEAELDIIIDGFGNSYAQKQYRIVKNRPNLDGESLALLCNYGNPVLGYDIQGDIITIYTD